jgi:hypothetical protein
LRHNTTHTWPEKRVITWILELQKKFIDSEMFKFKNIVEAKLKYYHSVIQGPHQPYNEKSTAAAHGPGSQDSFQSLGSPLGHTHLPQQSQYSGISAHKLNPQAKPEQLKLSTTDPSMWPQMADT